MFTWFRAARHASGPGPNNQNEPLVQISRRTPPKHWNLVSCCFICLLFLWFPECKDLAESTPVQRRGKVSKAPEPYRERRGPCGWLRRSAEGSTPSARPSRPPRNCGSSDFTAFEAADGCSQVNVADHDAPRFEDRCALLVDDASSTAIDRDRDELELADRIFSCRQPSPNRGHSKETDPPPANLALPSQVNVFNRFKLCSRMRAMRALVAGLLR